MPQLIEGSPVQVPGKNYIMRNVGGVYDCSCVAWKMQSRPIDQRTCKHLCAYLGVENERARVGNDNMPTKFKLSEEDVVRQVMEAPKKVAKKSSVHPLSHLNLTPAEADQVVAEVMEEAKEYPCLLAQTWKDEDPTGWWMSEKLDGVRACWDGENFRTRNNNILFAPDWFKAPLPKERLDGELWLGRDEFQKTMSIVRRYNPNGEWKQITFRIFDAQDAPGGFEDRYDHLDQLSLPDHAVIVEQTKCTGKAHLEQELEKVVKMGGEGLMLRKPGSRYEPRRSSTLLKVKPFHDMEVVVTGYTDGKGKHKGVVGALVCEHNGKSFKVGGGLTDAERANPPAVGASITIKYQQLTKGGIPRHASFVRVYQAV